MISHYNQNYTKDNIDKILDIIKDCIKHNAYTIAFNENRKENIGFITEYNLRSTKQKNILLKLKALDFCHTIQNIKKGYEDEVLYIFSPRVSLYNVYGIIEAVEVYIKINIINTSRGNRVSVISFHKRNKSINYLFK